MPSLPPAPGRLPAAAEALGGGEGGGHQGVKVGRGHADETPESTGATVKVS
jgi:hypothetical protein